MCVCERGKDGIRINNQPSACLGVQMAESLSEMPSYRSFPKAWCRGGAPHYYTTLFFARRPLPTNILGRDHPTRTYLLNARIKSIVYARSQTRGTCY